MYIEQAYKGLPDIWRYVVGFLTVFIIWQFLGVIPLVVALLLKSESDFLNVMGSGDMGIMADMLGSNAFLFFMLLTFLIGLIGLFLYVKFVHRQSLTSLTTSRKKIDWKRIFFAFIIWAVVSALFVVLDLYLSPEDYEWNFKLVPFLILAIIAIIMIPIQTSMEEYYMRGYMMQGLGIITKNRWVPLLVTSLLFGAAHLLNPEVDKLGYGIMVFYMGTGLLLGVMTLMDGGLELALGFHAANNLFTALLVTADWTAFQTESIYRDISEPTLSWDVFVPVLVIYPIILLIFSKKYGWTDWRERLTGKIRSREDFLALPSNETQLQNPS
jgi:membrane protease YdiL (CAAX protease family)